MEPIEQHYVDKSSWGPGPWQAEPDKVEWRHPENGLPCLIVRGPGGALCGYVACPPGHPLHGADGFSGEPRNLDVHGGITFGDKCAKDGKICHVARPGEPDDVWWLGFDCNHSWDIAPGSDAQDVARGWAPRSYGDHHRSYKSIAYVHAEVQRLAVQIFEAGKGS
jgi:hypothetical protein